jgi:hypothetical protein
MENAQLKVIIGDNEQDGLQNKTISEIIGRNAGEATIRHRIQDYFKDDSEQPNKFGKLGDILKKMSSE